MPLRSKVTSVLCLLFSLDAIRPEDLVIAKGNPDRAVIDGMTKYSKSRFGGFALKAIERDMRRLATELRDVPADTRPLDIETYPFEGQAVAGCATPWMGARFLYAAIRTLEPKRVVEIGGAHGFGACYMATGLKHGRKQGRIDSLEGMIVRADHAQRTTERHRLGQYIEVHLGDFRDTLPKVMEEPPDIVFSDGDKSTELTRFHFQTCLQRMASGYLLFDDINHTPEISALFKEFLADPRIAWALTYKGRWAILRLQPGQPAAGRAVVAACDGAASTLERKDSSSEASLSSS